MTDETDYDYGVEFAAATTYDLFEGLVKDGWVTILPKTGAPEPVTIDRIEEAWRWYGVDAYAVPEGLIDDQATGRTHTWATFDHWPSETAWRPVGASERPKAVTVYDCCRYHYSHAEGGCYTWGYQPIAMFPIERGEDESIWEATARVHRAAERYLRSAWPWDLDTSEDHYKRAVVETVPLTMTSVGSTYYC